MCNEVKFTLKLMVYPNKYMAGGRYRVYLRLIHKSRSFLIGTGAVINRLEQLVDGRIVDHPQGRQMNEELSRILEVATECTSGKDFYGMSGKEIRDYIEHHLIENKIFIQGCVPDKLFGLLELYKDEMVTEGRTGKVEMVERLIVNLADITDDIELVKINRLWVEKIEHSLYALNFSVGTVSIYLKLIRTIFRWAESKCLTVWESFPFEDFRIRTAQIRAVDVSEQEFQQIKNAKLSRSNLIYVRDMFMLSFYLGGISFVDLLKAVFNGKTLEYIHVKCTGTKQTVTLDIPEEALPYINKWVQGDKIGNPWDCTVDAACENITRNLRRLAVHLDLKSSLTSKSPAKTFSQFALMAGVNDDVVKYCQGRSVDTGNAIYNYIRVTKRQADLAIRKVIDYSKNYAEYEMQWQPW